MYQVNYLPWRQNLIRKCSHIWLYQSATFIIFTLILCGYYTYSLVQKQQITIAQHIEIQQQESTLAAQLEIYQHEKQQADLNYQRYQHRYQNWLRYLYYIRFFQSIEKYLPPTAWISHYTEVDNLLSLQLMLPRDQSLFFIRHIEDHPFFSSLRLRHLQQHQTYPSYVEIHLEGHWQHQENKDIP